MNNKFFIANMFRNFAPLHSGILHTVQNDNYHKQSVVLLILLCIMYKNVFESMFVNVLLLLLYFLIDCYTTVPHKQAKMDFE